MLFWVVMGVMVLAMIAMYHYHVTTLADAESFWCEVNNDLHDELTKLKAKLRGMG